MGRPSSVSALKERLTQPPALVAMALLLGVAVWIWAAHHSFMRWGDPRLARIDLGQGAEQQQFVRDAQGRWRVASFDHVPADVVALEAVVAQSLRGPSQTRQLPIVARDAQGQILAQGAVSRSLAHALVQRPYAPSLAKPPYLPAAALQRGLLMGQGGPARALDAGEVGNIVRIINDIRPAAVRPGSRILWRELVMVELHLQQGGRLYVQATHDGRWLWIRITGNSAAAARAGRRDVGQRFNDFRNFAYAIAPARWPATLLPSQPKCDPTLSPTPCPKPVP